MVGSNLSSDSHLQLAVRNIHKSFGSHKVLRGISLDAYNHDVISILGTSGSLNRTILQVGSWHKIEVLQGFACGC